MADNDMSGGCGPLDGIRVLDYSQFVAGPLATMLLGDLGADVVKVESPGGDAYREYEPLGNKQSRRFMALNRGKRSVVLDLTDSSDLARSQRLIASADVIVHNMPGERARRFGLDGETVHSVNPDVVLSRVSAFGPHGPLAEAPGYDLIAQAYSGLLFADPREGQDVPRRCGHIPLADVVAGLLTVISALTGLLARPHRRCVELDVSLLGAALLTQVQDFVRLADDPPPTRATATTLAARARHRGRMDSLEPYYGCYATADGFLALACLKLEQRLRVVRILGLDDPWAANPQQPPETEDEYQRRAAIRSAVAAELKRRRSSYWVRLFGEAKVPCTPVRTLDATFSDEQVTTNGLVRTIAQTGLGAVTLLGSVLQLDGQPLPLSARPAPELGEHDHELLDRSSS